MKDHTNYETVKMLMIENTFYYFVLQVCTFPNIDTLKQAILAILSTYQAVQIYSGKSNHSTPPLPMCNIVLFGYYLPV